MKIAEFRIAMEIIFAARRYCNVQYVIRQLFKLVGCIKMPKQIKFLYYLITP